MTTEEMIDLIIGAISVGKDMISYRKYQSGKAAQIVFSNNEIFNIMPVKVATSISIKKLNKE